MSRKYMFVDIETYSETDIGKCGSYKYMEDPAFEILLLAYAFDDEPVKVVDLASGESWPEEVLDALKGRGIKYCIAHNTAFEREAFRRALGLYQSPEWWFDTMHLSAQCGLPLSLGGVGEALSFSEDQAKMKEGKALIRYFCLPCKPTKVNGQRTRNLPEHAPEKWQIFKDYCGRDVETMREIFKILKPWAPGDLEKRFWNLDTQINERGVRIDRQLATNAVAMNMKSTEELTERAVEITGLSNPKSVSQVKNWLSDQEGKEFPSLNKKVVTEIVTQLKTDEAKEFMSIRSELSKSSVSKYAAMLRSACKDDHIRGTLLFYGAGRTGRYAGRLIQPQNFPQNKMEDLDGARALVRGGHYTALKALYDGVSQPLSELIRTAIIPEDGHQLLVADFSAIEARVLAWLAGEQWRLDVFLNGGDIYCQSASQAFKVPVEKHGVNSHLRQKGKIMELACGYGGSVGAMKAFGADKLGMSEQEIQETVDLWRASSPKVVQMWWDIGNAAAKCISRKCHVETPYKGVCFDFEKGIMWMTLPSGRRLAYFGARYEESKRMPGKKVITYMGTHQQTRKWVRLESYGPKLVENLTQAVARDCLRDSMMALDAEGYDIRFTVHDEIIATEPLDGRSAEDMAEVMSRTLPWAEGLPLKAEAYACSSYRKD